MTETTIIRMRDVVRLTGVSRSRIYLYMKHEHDAFPRPLRLGPNSVGWLKSEVEEWIRTRERAGSARA